MSFLRSLFVVAFLALISSAEGAASLDARYNEARAAFEKGDFRAARRIAETLVREKQFAPELFQLLGNTFYRLNDPGTAALWYQRAALFSPPLQETRQNLAHLHERTGNLVFDTQGIHRQFSSLLSRSKWLAIAAVCGWTLVLSVILAFLYFHRGNSRAFLLTLATLALLVGTCGLLGWFWHPSDEAVRELAVITATNARAYPAASVVSGREIAELPPGSQVRKLDDRGTWSYVEFRSGGSGPDGRDIRGWVQTKVMSPLWPYDLSLLN